jgi:hypothetical protein
MPRLGFQRRRDGSFVYFPGPFALRGAYALPDAALEAIARAAREHRKRNQSLLALVLAACLLLGAFSAYPLSVEISASFDADRAAVEKSLRLACLLAGLLAGFLLLRHRRRRFARRHLAGFAFLPEEPRAVLFRPRTVYTPLDLRLAGLGIAFLAVLGWLAHLRGFTAAYTEGGRWAVVVEAEIAVLLALLLGHCGFLLRHAGRLRRRRVAFADATERWAEMEIASGWQRRGEKPLGPRPLIWRVLLPDFGHGPLAGLAERAWIGLVWGTLLTTLGVLLVLGVEGKL